MSRNVKTGNCFRNGEVKQFYFYTDLKAAEKISFVKSVTNVLVGENYYSFMKDMIFDFYIIDTFTDWDLSDIKEGSDNIGYIEKLLGETNIVEIVKSNVDKELIEELSKAVDDNIAYKVGFRKDDLTTSVVSLINTINNKIKDVDLEALSDSAVKLAEIKEKLNTDNLVESYLKLSK